ncbi:transporter substrate-binding domain-containing protein [Terasakiella sp. SH-1]|uniref:substrate-binding periplasmic protein n=1 Tax=Terasakiella sp. SH-1 TaxID=2560057 RepID=UPI0010737114|nr:transporter substrate-binding domain-containing protein [Terasakiella sp. SH-1]
MKRQLAVFFFLLLGMVVPARAHDCTKVVVTAHPEYPPYHWHEDGKIVGASVALTEKIFKELGVEVEARYEGPWKRVLANAQANHVDMVLALKKTEERSKFLNYTTSPIFPNPFAVFVKVTRPFDYTQWKDLLPKRGGKNAGDRYGEPFDSFARKYLELEDGFSTASNVKKLINGRIDYFIHGRYVGLAHFATIKEGDQVVALAQNINEGVIHSGFTKGSPCNMFLPYVSRRYQEMIASGEAVALLQQYVKRWSQFAQTKVKN